MMKLLRLSLMLIFCLGISSTSFAQPATKKILHNGMTVVVTEMPDNPMVSVYGLVKVGSATEGKWLGTGAAHYVEHMLFKGTDTRAVGEMAQTIQSVGGYMNAQTSFDYTLFIIDVPYEKFDVALDILSDAIMHSTFDAQEVEKERTVIHGEMRLYEDNPPRVLSEQVFRTVYLEHTYRHPIIGYRTLFDAVTRDDLYAFYKYFYVPNNMVISVAGNIKSAEVMPKIEQAFAEFERARPITRNLPQEPEPVTPKSLVMEYPMNLTYASLSFLSVPLMHEDLYALDVLSAVFSQGKSARLHNSIVRDQKLAQSISSSNYTPIDRGIFEIEAILTDDRTDELLKAEWKIIEDIKTNGVKKEELEKARRRTLFSFVTGKQKTQGVAYGRAVDEAFAGDHNFSEKYIEGIRQVTNEDVRRVAKKYLTSQRATTVILKPVDIKKNVDAMKEKQVSSIEKIVLENGLTVLLKQDDAFPLVSMQLLMNGGSRFESEGVAGVGQLMSSVWTEGSKKYSREKLSDELDRLGASFGGFSGRNSFGLKVDCLDDSVEQMMNIMEDVLKNPLFLEKDIEIAKNQQLTSIKLKLEQVPSNTINHLYTNVFTSHYLKLDQQGSQESVAKLKQKDLIDMYRKLTTPSNMVLTVFGNYKREEMLVKINQKFGSLKNHPVDFPKFSMTKLSGIQEEILRMPREQAMVAFGFQGVGMDHPDRYALSVAVDILSTSFSGRLFNKIRDEFGQAYNLGGGLIPAFDGGMVYIYVLTTQEHIDSVRQLVLDEIKNMQSELVTDEELANIKTMLKGDFKSSLQTNSSLAFTAGLDELYGFGYLNYQTYDSQIDAVTKQDVKQVMNKYLTTDTMAVVTTLPEEK